MNHDSLLSELEKITPHLPTDNYGSWNGQRGNGTFELDMNHVWSNEGGKTWKEVIEKSRTPNITEVPFQNGFPVFTPVDFKDLNKNIKEPTPAVYHFPQGDSMKKERYKNYQKADAYAAKILNKEPEDMEKFRNEHQLAWHEKEDMETMLLVSRAIHNHVPHSGGISAVSHGGPGETPPAVLEARNLFSYTVYWNGLSWMIPSDENRIEVIFYCADQKGPSEKQLEYAESLKSSWSKIMAQVDQQMPAFMEDEYGQSEWEAGDCELLIYKSGTEAGIFFTSSVEQEHGLGAYLCGDEVQQVGTGDIAL